MARGNAGTGGRRGVKRALPFGAAGNTMASLFKRFPPPIGPVVAIDTVPVSWSSWASRGLAGSGSRRDEAERR